MKVHKKSRKYKITALLLYLIFCAFLWCFLVAATRSHNRLTHQPAAMAQLVIQPDSTAELRFADGKIQWHMPKPHQNWIFWVNVLPDFAGSAAVWTWHDLYDCCR